MLTANLNFNLLSSWGNFLPRTQIVVTGQKPMYSTKVSAWNRKEIASTIWDKTYFEVLARQSLANIKIIRSSNLLLSPKLVGLYSYSLGNKETCFGLGGEVSLHRPFVDDFLTVYGFYKIGAVKNIFVFGASLNIASLLRKL